MKELAFRTVAPGLSPLRFSRTDKLSLAYHGQDSVRPRTVEAVKAELQAQPHAALALYHPDVLPPELIDLFKAVQNKNLIDLRDGATPFFDDLKKYCRAVGFASRLELELSSGLKRPLAACNFLVGEPDLTSPRPLFLGCNFRTWEPEATQREFFGEAYEPLIGRSVLVSPWQNSLSFGPIGLALYIAHEVACIKLIEEAARLNMKAEEISKAEEIFYAHAYSYNFTYALYSLVQLLPKEFLPLMAEFGAIGQLLPVSYQLAMSNFEKMGADIRARYLIAADRRFGMAFLCPFSVNLRGPGQPPVFLQPLPRQGPQKA
jgi:hypothetical protein